ncbi:MAG TPA: hypothetical protein VGL94_09900 [Ktedonobacteraceae bacterium]|jgi:DNA repair exonuclease SbcCD ATPase subunit
MNQPADDRIKKIEERQEDFDKRLKSVEQQRTEEIKAVRVEVASEDVLNRLKTLEQGQQDFKEDTAVLKDDAGVLKIEMQGARADILQIRESQSDLRDRLIEHSEDLKVIKGKQDAHTEILDKLISFAESHDAMLKTVATKEDLAAMVTKEDINAVKDDIASLKSTQEQILALLQQKP